MLADALAGEHRNLRVNEINLGGNQLTDEGFANLFEIASPAFSQSLNCVNISNKVVGPKAISSLTSVLAKSLSNSLTSVSAKSLSGFVVPVLTMLEISDSPLGADGLRALRDTLCAGKIAHVENLFLAGSLTSNAETNAEFILSLGHFDSLGVLDLSRNNLGVPGGKALGKVLSDHPNLTSLILTETMLGNKGVSALVENIISLDLLSLYLDKNGIQAAGVSCLAKSVCAGCVRIPSSFLSTFFIVNNPLGLEGVTAVVKILTSDHFRVGTTDLSGCQLTAAERSASNPDLDNALGIHAAVNL